MPRKREQQNITEVFRDLRSDYAAARPSRFRRTRYGLYGSGDSHYASEQLLRQWREYSRDMSRNDAIIEQGVRRAAANQVQNGFTFKPDTGDEKINTDLRGRMREWANDPDQCDVAGERTLSQFEFMAALAELTDGDIFLLGQRTGQLQMVESHLCRTPLNTSKNVVHGVLLDAARRHLQYWFCPENLNPYDRFEKVSDARKIDTVDEFGNRVVFQLYDPSRSTQTRGVPWCHACFDENGMWQDANFALLVKQQMAACLAWSWEKDQSFKGYGGDMQTGDRQTQEMPAGNFLNLQSISAGAVLNPPTGMKLVTHSPNLPSSESMAHMRAILQIIFLNLGLPLFMALLDGNEGSFSSLRTIFDQAKISFKLIQNRRKAQFYTPMTRWKISQWLEDDAALRNAVNKTGIDVFKHSWDAPGWPYLQPLHDVQADKMRLQNLMASPTMLHSEEGRQYAEVLAECVRDNGAAIEAAVEEAARINKVAGEPVCTWRDVLNRDMPEGDQITLTEKANATAA